MNIDTASRHITPADGNVFADLGFEPEEAATLKAESQRRISESIITHVTPVGGNVFADLGFEADEAAKLLAETDKAISEKLAIKETMKDRPRDDAMAEIFRKDPAYAGELLNSILEDGDPGELLIALRQMTQAFDGAAKDAEPSDIPITLTRREALRLLEIIENPPPRNENFLKALARYVQQKQS